MATYTYANDNNLCAQFPIATKEYTLTEIYDELRNMKERVAHSKAHVACAKSDLTMYVKEHTLKDIQVDATEFHQLQKSRDERKADLELLTIALEGIRGAIRYYQAEALNKAYREVLPSTQENRLARKPERSSKTRLRNACLVRLASIITICTLCPCMTTPPVWTATFTQTKTCTTPSTDSILSIRF